jgi:hypothetical protein
MERQSSNNVLKLDSSIYRDDDNQKDCKIINKTNGGDNYKNISIKLNKNKSNIPNKKNSNILNIDVNFEYNDPNYYSLSSANSLSGSGTPCF